MAWTPASFRAIYAEFRAATDDLVQNAIDQATRMHNATNLGDKFDDAVGLQAAEILANSPFGRTQRLDGGDGKPTRYMTRLDDLIGGLKVRMIVI